MTDLKVGSALIVERNGFYIGKIRWEVLERIGNFVFVMGKIPHGVFSLTPGLSKGKALYHYALVRKDEQGNEYFEPLLSSMDADASFWDKELMHKKFLENIERNGVIQRQKERMQDHSARRIWESQFEYARTLQAQYMDELKSIIEASDNPKIAESKEVDKILLNLAKIAQFFLCAKPRTI